MELQEAKNLKISDTVFVINKLNNVWKKIVTGIKLINHISIDVTYIDSDEKNVANGFSLPHSDVFLKEKDALTHILHDYKNQKGTMELKIREIETKIKKLRHEKIRKHIEKYGE